MKSPIILPQLMIWKLTETWISSVTLYQLLRLYGFHFSVSAFTSKFVRVLELEAVTLNQKRAPRSGGKKWKRINRGQIRVRTKELDPSSYFFLFCKYKHFSLPYKTAVWLTKQGTIFFLWNSKYLGKMKFSWFFSINISDFSIFGGYYIVQL